MSCLFISANWPHPLGAFRHGLGQRMRLLLRAAQASGPLDLMFFHAASVEVTTEDVDALRADLKSLWAVEARSVRTAPAEPPRQGPQQLWRDLLVPMAALRLQPGYSWLAGPAQRRAVAQALQATQPTLVLAHRLAATLPLLGCGERLPPWVLDLDDIEHKAFRRALDLPPQWGAKRLMRLWVPALRHGERVAVRQAAATLVCSEPDERELARLHGVASVHAMPNALPVPQAAPLPGTPTALFLGLYSYAPNRDAAELLIAEVWPRVRARCPEARLFIAGHGSETLCPPGKLPAGVELLGFVDNLGALYARTQVVVCPLRSGGGTRVKIIEAALQGRPVVATAIGAEGLVFDPAHGEIVIRDGVEPFVEALCDLFGDPQRAGAIGAAARARALGHYADEAVVRRLTALMAKLRG